MNGPTRSSSFDRRVPSGGGRTRGPAADVFDELDQFVDSEPVSWPGAVRTPVDPEREAARGRLPKARGGAEGDIEPAFSRKPARQDAFLKKLDEELAKPPERRAERAAPPERPEPSARPAMPDRSPPAPERSGAAPTRPAVKDEPRRPGERDAFARSAAAAVDVPAPAGRPAAAVRRTGTGPAEGPAPKREAAPAAATRREAMPPPGGAPAPSAAPPAGKRESERSEPADALDWELDNAISAIVANRKNGGGGASGELPPLPGAPREPRAEPAPQPPASRAERQAPPAVVASPGPSRLDPSRPAPSASPAAPVAPLGTKRAKPIQTFRYERPEDPQERIPPAPPDVDDPLQSVFFPDARQAFDEVHGSVRQGHDPYLSELAQDDEEFDPDAEWDRPYRTGEEELPASLSRAARASRSKPRLRSAGIAAAVGGIAVLGIVAVVGINVLAGGDETRRSGEPPIIRADARDVKERPEESGAPETEPDVIEQTELTGTGELVVPDTVRIGGARPASEAEAEESFPSRQVRTLVVRPDGTILPAGPEAEAASPRTGAGVRTVTPQAQGEAEAPRSFDVASIPRGEVRLDAPGFPAGPEQAPRPDDGRGLDEEAGVAGTQGVPGSVAVPRPRPAAPSVTAGSSRQGSEPVRLGPERQVASAPAARQPAPAAAAADAPWGVQLASRRSRSAAEDSFRALQRSYPSLLGGLEPVIVRAEVGDRGTFYRVRIAAESRGEAAALCQRLKAAGADCFIGRN